MTPKDEETAEDAFALMRESLDHLRMVQEQIRVDSTAIRNLSGIAAIAGQVRAINFEIRQQKKLAAQIAKAIDRADVLSYLRALDAKDRESLYREAGAFDGTGLLA